MAGNPYFVEPQNNFLSDVARSLIALRGQDISQKLSENELAMRGQQLAEMARKTNLETFGSETAPTPGTPTLATRQVATQESHVAKQPPLPKYQEVINPSDVITSKNMTAKAFGDGAVKVFEPAFSLIDEVAKSSPTTTNWDAYTNIKSAYPGIKDQIVQNAQKYMLSPEFAKLQPTQQKAFTEMYNALQYDQTGDTVLDRGMFKNTVATKAAADLETKSALLAERIAGWESTRTMREEGANYRAELRATQQELNRLNKDEKTGTWVYDGTNAEGLPMYHNNKTMEERTGATKIQAKPAAAKPSNKPNIAADLGLVPKMDEVALKADLIKNGYDEAGANEYIKKAKSMGKL